MISIKPDQDVLEAMKKEGPLGKQGRSVMNKYFQRYWKIIDDGLTLGYSHSKQDFDQGQLSGKVALKDVLKIVDEDKPKKFQLVCEGRVYKLEADSPAEKKSWISALSKCMNYATKHATEEKKDLLAIDDDIIFEESEDLDEKTTEKFNLLQPIGFTADLIKTVAIDTAISGTVNVVKKGVTALGDAITQKNKMATNEEFLKMKKLNSALDNIDPNILKSRILMGYLYKETKETFGYGIVDDVFKDVGIKDALTRQWFLLVSSKPIVFDQVDRDDEEILDAGKLPFDIDPEVLYAYNENCDASPPVQTIPMKDVIDVTIKKKANREQFYRFILNLGNKKIYLITHNLVDMNIWVKAVQASRAVIKEQAKSKLPVVKNLYWHKRILDEQGEEDLMEKIEMDYERIVGKIESIKLDGVKGLISTQKVVADELISVINACLVQKTQRKDIIKFYMGIFHENIVLSFRNYFKKNDKNLDNKDCFEMINFLVGYRDMIRLFGDAFSDKRINEGINSLCTLVARRVLKTNLESVQNIIKQEISAQPRVGNQNRLVTTGPQDIFRIVNESFQLLSFCSCQEFAFALLEIEKYTLLNYQEGLGYIIENCKINVNQLAAFCNNTVTYVNSVKEFVQQAETISSIEPEKIPQYFDEGVINKGFANVSKKAYESMAEEQFSKLTEEWRTAYFLDIDLRMALAHGLRGVQSIMDKIHSNYTSKVDLACLEKIVTIYIQNFLENAEKRRFKRGDCARISSKLQEDELFLKDLFSKNLKANVIESVTASISSFHDFLNTNYAFLSMLVKTMKETYGDAIKWFTFDALIRIRDDELEQQERDEMFQLCEETFKVTQKKEEKIKAFNVFKHLLHEPEEDDLYADTSDDSFGSNGDSSVSSDSSQKDSPNVSRSFADQYLEGYLDADKDEFFSGVGGLILSNLKFERRYFTIRRNALYFYKAKSSQRAIGSYNLKDVTDCAASPDDSVTFYIELQKKEGGTIRKVFKAENADKREIWINAIKEAKALNGNDLLEVNASEVNFFKDTKPLFHEVEKMPDLRFEGAKKAVKNVKKDVMGPQPDNYIPRPQTAPKKESGCCAALCRLFGIGDDRPKNNGDYMQIKEVL